MGCRDVSSAQGPSRAEYERRLIERHHITAGEARCTARYVFDAYEPGEIAALYETGMQAIALDRWSEFGQGLLACSLHDQLVDDSGWPEP